MLEYEIYDWLNSHQINIPQHGVFGLTEELQAAAFPVSLKIASAKVVHKSDVGGVLTDLTDQQELNKAKETILNNLQNHGINLEAGEDKFLVTKMVEGVELFFGIIDDPCFGKVIVFGAGGVYTELFKDICFIDSEAEESEIRKAISSTKISRLFTEGFRGKQYDMNLLVNFIRKLQQLDVQEMDLNPVMLSDHSLTVVDARLLPLKEQRNEKAIKVAPELFTPGKIAIVGVSSHAEKIGYALAYNTASKQHVYFVNPNLESLLGRKVFHSIDELPNVDTAVLAVRPVDIEDSIQQLVTKNVRTIIIITAGLKEVGKDEKFLSDLAARYKLNIVGPNCLGIYANGLNLTFATQEIHPGAVNFFSQSGAIAAELIDKAAARKLGFENIVSVGNMADIDFADLISSYGGENPINLYIEGISHGKNLLRAIRRSRCRIKIFKAGKTEAARKAAFSHTGNMAGNYEMFVSLLRSLNVEFARDVNGLLYPYHFRNILIITNAGGEGTIMSDLISEKLYRLSKEQIDELSKVLPPHWSKNNPIDIIGDAGRERYKKALEVVDSFGADAIFVLLTPQFMTDPLSVSRIFIDHNFQTPVFPVVLGGKGVEAAKRLLQENEVTYFEELAEAVSFL